MTRNPQRILRATLLLTHAEFVRTTPPQVLSVFMTSCARALYTAIDITRTRAQRASLERTGT
jgi:kynureninase